MSVFKPIFKLRRTNDHVTGCIYLLDMRRLPACFFLAPTPISFSVLLLSFIAFTIPIQFFALCNYTSGMCNIITRRTLQMVGFRDVRGLIDGHSAKGKWLSILVAVLFFLHMFSFKNAISQQKTHICPERNPTSGPFTQIIVKSKYFYSTRYRNVTDYNTAAVFDGRRFKYWGICLCYFHFKECKPSVWL